MPAMKEQSSLALRVRSPPSQPSRSNFTDVIVLTPHSPSPHTPQKPGVQMSPTTLTPVRRPSSPLPSSVPRAPRAMLPYNPSTPTKRVSPVRVGQLSLVDSRQKSTTPSSATPSPSKTEPLPLLILSKRPKVGAVAEPPAAVRQPNKVEVRCWACGMGGHDMMECKHFCGHCGQVGHNSIACQYRTLPGGKEGKVVLDGKLGEIEAATAREVEECSNLNQERASRIEKAKNAKEEVQKGKAGKKGGVSKTQLAMRLSQYVPKEPRLGNYEVMKGWRSPGLEGERKRRSRAKSHNPNPHYRGEYRCETDGSPPRYREMGYHERDYRSGVYRNARTGEIESPRIAYNRRGYIPEENGKWRRELSPDREEMMDWR